MLRKLYENDLAISTLNLLAQLMLQDQKFEAIFDFLTQLYLKQMEFLR